MQRLRNVRRSVFVGACCTLSIVVGWAEAEPPAAPPLSTVVSAAPLAAAVGEYLAALRPLAADEAGFAKNKTAMAQQANAIVALAQVLGNHDEPGPYRAGAVELMAAAATLSRAKDFAAAKAAFGAMEAAVEKTAAGAKPKWEKAARLGMLMEEIQSRNNDLRRKLRRLERNQESGARDAAVLAAFGQTLPFDTHEVKNDADLPRWYAMSTEFRDAAAELSRHFAAGDEAGAQRSLERVEKSCAACHEVFHHE